MNTIDPGQAAKNLADAIRAGADPGQAAKNLADAIRAGAEAVALVERLRADARGVAAKVTGLCPVCGWQSDMAEHVHGCALGRLLHHALAAAASPSPVEGCTMHDECRTPERCRNGCADSPGGWVPDVGWVALLGDLPDGSYFRMRADGRLSRKDGDHRGSIPVIVCQWPDRSAPAAPSSTGEPSELLAEVHDADDESTQPSSYTAADGFDEIEALLGAAAPPPPCRHERALREIDALDPADFMGGQGHLAPAFREVDFRHAFRHVCGIVNRVLHGTDADGHPLPVEAES